MRRTPLRPLHLVLLLALALAGCGQPQRAASSTPLHPPSVSSPAAGSPTAVPVAAGAATPIAAAPTPMSVTVAPPATPAVAVATPAGTPSPLTVAEVYHRTTQALARPGLLYHATIRVEVERGTGSPRPEAYIREQWVDAGRDVAREEWRAGPGSAPAVVTIVTGPGSYSRSPDGQVQVGAAATCHGTGVAAAAVLGCVGPGPHIATTTVTVEDGWYAGRAAIVLVSTSDYGGTPPGTVTSRLYLGADTFLPLALESDDRLPSGSSRTRAAYAHEFLPVAAVPATFFDPASIGYAGPAAPLDQPGAAGLVVYWLGERHAGADGLPPLALGQVETSHPQGPGDRFTLFYGAAAAPFGLPLVRLQEWPRAAWDALPPESRDPPPCWAQEELALPGGRATILLGVAPEDRPGEPPRPTDPAACPAGPHNTFSAQAYLGGTVVLVFVDNGPGNGPNPYNTRAGVEAVLRALVPRAAATAPSLPGLPQTGAGHGRAMGDGDAR